MKQRINGLRAASRVRNHVTTAIKFEAPRGDTARPLPARES